MIARLFISPSLEERVGEIKRILSEAGLSLNHPDLLYFPDDSKLGIEQARKIKEHFSLKPYSSKGRAVVLEDASVITVEAQNALLKTLEEPPEEAMLLLGANSDADLLPTVLSRVQIVILGDNTPGVKSGHTASSHTGSGTENDRFRGDLEILVNSTLEERFAYVEKLKERPEFLHFMVSFFRQKLLDTSNYSTSDRSLNNSVDQLKFFIRELLEAEQWAAQNVNIRAILEYLMLVMPKGK